jgi:hypothetical protein
MEETILKLRILAKAETTLMRASARRAAMRARLFAMAIGLLLLTVVMVNLAAFEFLSQTMSEAAAAGTMALVNGILAVIVIFGATRVQPGPEEAMVQDIREMALAELSADLDEVKDEFNRISSDLDSIRSGVGQALGFLKPGGSAAGSLMPVIGLITSMLKK